MQNISTIIKGAFAPTLLMMVLSSASMADPTQANSLTGKIGFSSTKAVCCTQGCEDITFGFIGALGYDLNQYIGIEGRLIQTVWEYEQQRIKRHMGIFAKPMYPISDDLSLYGLIGYGQTQTGDQLSSDDNGLGWGAGVNYYFDRDHSDSRRRIGLFLDYERLIQKSGVPDLDSINIGLSYSY